MIPTELNLMDVIFLILIMLIFILLIRQLSSRREMERKNKEKLDEMYNSVIKQQDYMNRRLDNGEKKVDSLQRLINEKTKAIAQKVEVLEKKNKILLEQKRSVVPEIEQRVIPIKNALNDALKENKDFQTEISEAIGKCETDLKKTKKQVNRFANEIELMKDAIKERTIDFEF